jgi:undecaprenyl diphosphate synthase
LLLREFLSSERQEMLDRGIRLRAVGRLSRLPAHVRQVLDEVIAATAGGAQMTLTLALSYGGREEIADHARLVAERVARGELSPSDVDETLFERELPTMAQGPVDLLVRTGGEQRISNFLLWATAYAEMVFSADLWPDWGAEQLFDAIASFQARDRRFGRAKSDVALSDERRALEARVVAHG